MRIESRHHPAWHSLWALLVASASLARADFFVSPRGDDRWSGRSADPGAGDGPFATIARAREAVRTLRKSQKEPQTVRVVLRGGTYFFDRPLEFGPEDSGSEKAPVIYAAAPGERVVVSGGRRLEGGRWGEANGRKAWIVNLPEVKEGRWRFRQLFVKGQRRPRTRLPKQGEYRIESLPVQSPSNPCSKPSGWSASLGQARKHSPQRTHRVRNSPSGYSDEGFSSIVAWQTGREGRPRNRRRADSFFLPCENMEYWLERPAPHPPACRKR